MFYIASKIKKESEVGYILYMWQQEDVARAYGCDAERIQQEYIPQFHLQGEALRQECRWWEDLVEMMRSEGVLANGHVQLVKSTLALLADKHQELLADPKETVYNAAYYHALPFVVELRAQGNNREKGEIELCLEALYGVTLLRLQKKEVTRQTQEAHDRIAQLLTLLNAKYKEEKNL